MTVRHRLRLARPAEVRALARGCLFASAVTGLTVLQPYSPTAPRTFGAVLTVLALVIGLALWRNAERTAQVLLHGVVLLATALIAACVAVSTTPGGTVTTAASFLWVAIYSAMFHTRHVMLRHLVVMALGLGIGLWHSGVFSALQTWWFLGATVGAVAWVLNDKVADLRHDATYDALTGVLSRRALLDTARREIARAGRTGQTLTLVVVDLDGFKRVNDTEGHAAGDALLVRLSEAWQGVMRPGDLVGRLGGDEFAVLLPGADADVAVEVVGRMRAVSGDAGWSAGIAPWLGQAAGPEDDVDRWLSRADGAMYEAKRARRASAGPGLVHAGPAGLTTPPRQRSLPDDCLPDDSRSSSTRLAERPPT